MLDFEEKKGLWSWDQIKQISFVCVCVGGLCVCVNFPKLCVIQFKGTISDDPKFQTSLFSELPDFFAYSDRTSL